MTVTETSDAWSNGVWLSVLACVMGDPMPEYPWPPFAYFETVHEVLHAVSHLWKHADDRFNRISREIAQMSQSLSDRLDAATAAIETDVAAVSAEVSQLLAGMTPGSTITEAQVARVEAIDAALKAIPPATPVVIPPPATV